MAIIFLLPWLEELEKCDSCTEKCCPPIMRGSVLLYDDFPPGTVECDSTPACHARDSNCTCCMYSYAPLSRSFKVFAAVRQSIYCLRIYR